MKLIDIDQLKLDNVSYNMYDKYLYNFHTKKEFTSLESNLIFGKKI